MTFINKINRYLTGRVRYKVTMKELSALTDRELADIGINRCDISRIAEESI